MPGLTPERSASSLIFSSSRSRGGGGGSRLHDSRHRARCAGALTPAASRPCWAPAGPAAAPLGEQLGRPRPRSSRPRAAPPRCARRARGPAGGRARRACASSLTGTPSWRTGRSAPGWSISTTISRARTSSESSASSSSSTGSRQQSCSRGERLPLARGVRLLKISLHLRRARGEPGARTASAISSSRPTPRHHACQNFGSSAPSETQPSAHSYGR